MTGGDDSDKTAGGGNASGQDAIDFHGAAIIDEEGHEIPITEEMIKEACKQLDPAAAEEAENSED